MGVDAPTANRFIVRQQGYAVFPEFPRILILPHNAGSNPLRSPQRLLLLTLRTTLGISVRVLHIRALLHAAPSLFFQSLHADFYLFDHTRACFDDCFLPRP